MITTRIGDSQRQILDYLKRHGSGTIPALAEALSLSVETVRTHLKALAAEGLTERRGQRRSGPGRPEIVHGLTDAAEALFPNREGQLLQDLVAWLDQEGHQDLVRTFFDQQADRRLAGALERLEGLDADARLEEVARVLSEEGFMAEIERDDQGEKALRLCHCPMRELVEVTRAPCRAELRLVRELLGRRLARVSYIPSGDAACCYALTPEGTHG